MKEDSYRNESSSRIWTRAEKALVDGDVATLDALLGGQGDMLRKGPVQPRISSDSSRSRRQCENNCWIQVTASPAPAQA